MTDVATKGDLTPARKRLVELMQRVGFGRIEGLVVRGGDPVLDPPPRVVREIKFCAENGPRPEAGKKDFALKQQVRDLFAEMEVMGNGVIRSIEIKHGLPFRMSIEEYTA